MGVKKDIEKARRIMKTRARAENKTTPVVRKKQVKRSRQDASSSAPPVPPVSLDTSDTLDKFLNKMDDPDDWRKLPNSDTYVTREEMDILYQLQQGNIANLQFDPFSVRVATRYHAVAARPSLLAGR